MEIHEEHDDLIPGRFPDYGAIFMSNSETKAECFRRRLLGLPSGQSPFVIQVKAGMILFLFEFERRQLHGVFQACTDGALNIIPHAFSSSGKQFPAQVKFTTIWRCSPLSEDEFRDAIRENYFSAKKFNFGLSEKQVRKLLMLFSSKKLPDNPRTIGYVMNKNRVALDDSSGVPINSYKNQWEEGSSFGAVIHTDSARGDSISNCGREIDGDSFTSANVRKDYKDYTKFWLGISNKQFEDPLCEVRRLAHDGQFLTSVVQNEHGVVNEHWPSFPTSDHMQSFATQRRVVDHVGSAPRYELGNDMPECLFKSESPVYWSKTILAENSLFDDQLGPSPAVPHSVEPQTYHHSVEPVYLHHSAEFHSTDSLSCSNFLEQSSRTSILSLEPGNTRYTDGNTGIMHSDLQARRQSVFSRLALNPEVNQEVSKQGHSNHKWNMDSSVDEVMDILHYSHHQWVRSRSYKSWTQRYYALKNSSDKKQVVLNSKLLKDQMAKFSKEMNISGSPAVEECSVQINEGAPFMDFKRRGKVRKNQDDVNTTHRDVDAESGHTLSGQHKRRKLIRPKFYWDALPGEAENVDVKRDSD